MPERNCGPASRRCPSGRSSARDAGRDGRTEVPVALPAGIKVLHAPRDLIQIFDRDLPAAGIPKADADGRTVDVHPDVHRDPTLATLVSKAGVVPRTARELMRGEPVEPRHPADYT